MQPSVRFIFVNSILIGSAVGSLALTEIGGDLPPVLKADKGPYLAVSDLYVPTGKTTAIDGGTVILFKNFTGLKAQGTLMVKGTAAQPVVFSSEFDTVYNQASTMRPNAFDWNGLYVDKDAVGTDLQHFVLRYSVYGVHAMTKFIRIQNGLFESNGRGNCSIEGGELPVGAEPFSYSLSVQDALADGVPIRILRDPQGARRNVVRWTSAALFVTGAVLGGYYTGQYNGSATKLENLSSRDLDNLTQYTDADWQQAKNQKYSNLGIAGGGYLLAVLGAVGFRWSFKF